MPASAAATAIVHFIGIIVLSTDFSAGVSTPPGPGTQPLQALMPRIPPRTGVLSATQTMGIEPHIAFIAFAESSFVSSSGWKWTKTTAKKGKAAKQQPPPFPKDPTLLWVQLDGEQMEILPDGKRPRAPQRPPHLALPKISSMCPGMKTLNRAFQAPFPGAAAVFELPAGEPKACQAVVQSKNIHRVDTEVKLPNNGTIVIREKRSGKRIVLDGKSTIYIAHIPKGYVDGLHYDATQTHDMAYYAMSPSGYCSPMGPFTASVVPDTCTSTMVMPHLNVVIRQPPQIDYFTDVQCSNSQWP